MRRLVPALAAVALTLVAAPSQAAEEAKKPGTGQYVDLAPVALPVVLDGRIINYVFVSVRVNLTSGANAPKLQSKEPYFRDALVRAAHRAPFTRYDDYTQLDDGKLKASLYADATAIAGPGQIASVSILSEQAKQHAGLPKPRSPHAR
ncbi:hypothetical protein ACO2Q3_07180 [Caulobacter sp. KR2-114]|uniref:hypothetical protein n=1 Tax=Caulobacter sp. KR2-114 TaxID=3400912 RepID=UPI003C080B9F